MVINEKADFSVFFIFKHLLELSFGDILFFRLNSYLNTVW